MELEKNNGFKSCELSDFTDLLSNEAPTLQLLINLIAEWNTVIFAFPVLVPTLFSIVKV